MKRLEFVLLLSLRFIVGGPFLRVVVRSTAMLTVTVLLIVLRAAIGVLFTSHHNSEQRKYVCNRLCAFQSQQLRKQGKFWLSQVNSVCSGLQLARDNPKSGLLQHSLVLVRP